MDTRGAAPDGSHPGDGAAPRLPVVNGLRGLAILGVIYFHLGDRHLTPTFWRVASRVGGYVVSPYTLLSNGWMGVNLFFVLSGFVLSLPYVAGHRSLAGPADARAFARRRARRLLPLFYLCLALGLLVESRPAPRLAAYADALAAATFTSAFLPAHFAVLFDAPLWSLVDEIWFSIAFPALLLAFRRFGALGPTAAALGVAFAVRYSVCSDWGESPVFLIPTKDGPLGRIDDFVVGVALCHLHARRPLRSPAAATAAVLLGGALVTAGAIVWDNIDRGKLAFVAAAGLNDLLLAGFSLLLLGLLGGAPRLLRAPFTVAPLRLAGAMCYSLYVWHLFGLHAFEDGPLGPYATLARVVVTLLVSALTYRLIEFPERSLRELFRPAA